MKEWGGQRYNTDFEPIDDQGNVIGPKNLEASEGWTNQNEPWRNSPGWHAQPLTAEQQRGIQQTNPTGWAERQAWRAANPTTANGAPVGGGQWSPTGSGGSAPTTGGPDPYAFNWGGWNVGGGTVAANPAGPSVLYAEGADPTLGANRSPGRGGMVRADNTTGPQTGGGDPMPGGGDYSWMPPTGNGQPLSPGNGLPWNYGQQGYTGQQQVMTDANGNVVQQTNAPQVTAPTLGGGPYNAPQMDSAALLSQLGPAPTVAQAGPMSAFGSDVQQSIQQGLGPAGVNTNDPAYRAQIDAFNRNSQRSADRTRAALAARANATGMGSGALDAQIRRVLSDQGTQEADFEAQLMASELGAARDRQARAQQLGAGLLSQEQQQSLTERLANQSGQLQTMGLQNTRDLANQGVQQQTGLANQSAQLQTQGLNSGRDIAQLQAQLQAMLGNQSNATQRYGIDTGAATQRYGIDATSRTAANALAQQGRISDNDSILRRNALMLQQQLGLGDLDLRRLGLTNQDNQFYAQLGQQLGLGTAQLNQQALLSLLGG